MCPTDTTPDPRDMLRAPDVPEFTQPKPEHPQAAAEPRADGAPVIAGERPPLPKHTEAMAADVEDEDADPVVDTGPGISDSELNRG